MKKVFIAVLVTLLVYSCGKKGTSNKYIQHSGYAAGTNYIIQYDNNSGDLKNELNSLMGEINQSITISNSQSAISKLNNNDSGIINNKYLSDVFIIASKIYTETKGMYDPTIKNINDWYGRDIKKFLYPELIDSTDLDSLKMYQGFDKVTISNGSVIKRLSSVFIDFSGIYHGYMADRIAELLDGYSIKNYRIEIGCVIKAKGVNTEQKPWLVILDKPTDEPKIRHQLGTIVINGGGFATAGSYRDFFTKGLMKLPYTIDPISLYPVKHTLISAGVFAPSAAEAEAYANAFMVMGPEGTKEFVASHPQLEVYLISANYKGEWQTYLSESLSSRLEGVKY